MSLALGQGNHKPFCAVLSLRGISERAEESDLRIVHVRRYCRYHAGDHGYHHCDDDDQQTSA